LARRIRFVPLNRIGEHWDLGAPFDIVFCRNVMIYFDSPIQRGVLQRMRSVMRGPGLLYVGHSENSPIRATWSCCAARRSTPKSDPRPPPLPPRPRALR
jgi:chemotaxis methyl-accepting protein methylase